MPKQRNGELLLPAGWDMGLDHDGKLFFIDHTTMKTTWVDPRDRVTKPPTFADCVGDELPVGWEEVWDSNVGTYFIDHINKCNQLEDPRQQYRQHQENMLKDYLVTASENLEAKKEIYSLKQQRLTLAQDECNLLKETLSGWKSSITSLNSVSSTCSSKHDPDLLRADVALAKNRVSRLKREIVQIQEEMKYNEKGLETLTQVSERMSGEHGVYSVCEAKAVLDEIFKIKQSLSSGEREKRDLLRSLAKLKDDFLYTKFKSESMMDVSEMSIDKFNAESQTDLTGEMVPIGQRLAEMTKTRLEYDEAIKQVTGLQHRLAGIEEQIVPGQNESDKDRLLLIQEKEQLLRELRGIGKKGRTKTELEIVKSQIHQLERDLCQAVETSNRQIADRLKLQEEKTNLVHCLAEAAKKTTKLESQLRSLSLSTLSISSGSSRGSLGSLSASSSKGSLNSLSFTDIYGQSQYGASDTVLQDLHHRVEKLLQGRNISPIHEVQHGSTGSVDSASGATSAYYHCEQKLTGYEGLKPLSPGSSLSSLSPPVSPGDVGPPPSYEQHMNLTNKKIVLGGGGNFDHTHTHTRSSDFNLSRHESGSNSYISNMGSANSISNSSHVKSAAIPPLPPSLTSDYTDSAPSSAPSSRPRSLYAENSELLGNAPLSPISEMGVCSAVAGGNTRTVSAAVSDESVAGDSGVFEASVKRSCSTDEVCECAQVQLKLRYEGVEGKLLISIEQGRKLSCLGVPQNAQVYIETLLLPDMSSSFKTHQSKDVNSPKYSEVFNLSIMENRLSSKTLQVNIMATTQANEAERVGWFQVSLADFADFDPKPRWYNVLPTKYIHSEQKSSSRGCISNNSPMTRDVAHLLEASSARLRGVSLGDEKILVNCDNKDIRSRSVSLETSLFRNVASLKEESSDESTIISSQTSTLTRNQGPDGMDFHKEGTPLSTQGNSEERSSQDEEDEDYDKLNPDLDLLVIHEDGSQVDDNGNDSEDDEPETCDKETNTEGNFGRKEVKRRSHGNRNSAVRRSQTFSPADRPAGNSDYICKLNRSDSDSSMPLYRRGGPFQRNSMERRSLRWKRKNVHERQPSVNQIRTSLDLELDFQASQSKLTMLEDEIERLKELKRRMEEAKANGETELPSWFSDNEQFQQLLVDANKLMKERTSLTRHDRRAEQLFNKVMKEAHRLRQRQHREPDSSVFREKMAFFTSAKMKVPVIPHGSDSEEDPDTPRGTTKIAEKNTEA